MIKVFRYTCSRCGESHEGAPSIEFGRPDDYVATPEEAHTDDTGLSTDFCVIEWREPYIRRSLEIPIHDYHEGFLWGIRLPVTPKDFEDYRTHYFDDDDQARYVGQRGIGCLDIETRWASKSQQSFNRPANVRVYSPSVPIIHWLLITRKFFWDRARELHSLAIQPHD